VHIRVLAKPVRRVRFQGQHDPPLEPGDWSPTNHLLRMHGDLQRRHVPTKGRPAEGTRTGRQEGSEAAHAVPGPQSGHDE